MFLETFLYWSLIAVKSTRTRGGREAGEREEGDSWSVKGARESRECEVCCDVQFEVIQYSIRLCQRVLESGPDGGGPLPTSL